MAAGMQLWEGVPPAAAITQPPPRGGGPAAVAPQWPSAVQPLLEGQIGAAATAPAAVESASWATMVGASSMAGALLVMARSRRAQRHRPCSLHGTSRLVGVYAQGDSMSTEDKVVAEAEAAKQEAQNALAAAEAAAGEGAPSGSGADATMMDAEAVSEAEKLFKEAFESEMERAGFLKEQVEVAVTEKLGSTSRITIETKDVMTPATTGGKTTWRAAYEAAKERTFDLEAQLKKARGMGEQAAPISSDESFNPVGESSADAPKIAEPVSTSRGGGQSMDQMEEVKKLQQVSEMALEEEAVLRLIAVAVLPSRAVIFGDAEENKPKGSLPSLMQAREALGDNLNIAEIVEFERCYIFRGTLPSSSSTSEALERMQQRVVSSGMDDVQLFLQPTKEKGQCMLVMLLEGDLPKNEMAWWQWVVFLVLFVTSFLAANATTFAVLPQASALLSSTDPDTVAKVLNTCVPTAGAILTTVGAQEAARRGAAAKYGVELSPPYFLPAWPFVSIGCLGAVTRRLSSAPSRESEYSMSLAAGIAGYVVSFAYLLVGLAAGPDPDGICNINYQIMPLLLKLVLKPFLGTSSVTNQPDPFLDPISVAYPASPWLIGGVIGIIITSLSLLPIGRLDGGVLARASFGGAAGAIGFLAWLLLASGSFAPDEAGVLYLSFGVAVIVWQNGAELAPKDAVTEVEGWQKALAILLVGSGVLLSIPGWYFPNI